VNESTTFRTAYVVKSTNSPTRAVATAARRATERRGKRIFITVVHLTFELFVFLKFTFYRQRKCTHPFAGNQSPNDFVPCFFTFPNRGQDAMVFYVPRS